MLTHPVVVWCVSGATLVALYTTSLLRLSAEHDLVHVAVHAHVLASGFLFCWTAVGVDPGPRRLPHPARVLFVLLAVPFHAVVAVPWWVIPTVRPAPGSSEAPARCSVWCSPASRWPGGWPPTNGRRPAWMLQNPP